MRILVALFCCLLSFLSFGQVISSVSPDSGNRGTFQLPIVISGSGTNFTNATSTVIKISQEGVYDLQVVSVNSVSPLSVSADIRISNDAPLGSYTVSVYDQTIGGMVDLPYGFTVLSNSQPPVLVGTTPKKAAINQVLPITISVDHASFSQATDNTIYLTTQGTSTILYPVPGSVVALNNSHIKAMFDFSGASISVGSLFDSHCGNSFDGYFVDPNAVLITEASSISGSIIYSGSYNGIVELYQQNTNITPNSYSLVASVPVSSNTYSFPNVAEASYYLRSVPIGMSDIVATYYPSDVSWITSTLVVTNSISPSLDIDITPVTSLSLPGGVTVSGTIGYGPSGFTKSIEGDIVFAEGVVVFLMDTDNSLYAQTVTDVNGTYTFIGVTAGNYTIVIDLPGYNQISSYNFEVTSSNIDMQDLNFLIDQGEIFPSEFMGLESNVLLSDLLVYPNPTTGEIHIQLPSNDTNSKVMIYNSLGQKIVEENVSTFVGSIYSIDFSEFGAGVYTIRVQDDQNVFETRLIKTK